MIHLDANATATIRPSVREALRRLVDQDFGNPSSVYSAGRLSRTLIRNSKKRIIRALMDNERSDVTLFFTSGGTESCNSLVHGFVDQNSTNHAGEIVTTAIEHSAMLDPIHNQHGYKVIEVLPDESSIVSVESIIAAVTARTHLVSIMAANNETGAIQPVAEVARALRASGYSGPIVSDFSQAFGKSELTVEELFSAGVSAVAISGHKLGALPGIGAVVLAGASYGLCLPFQPLLLGGGQEGGFRSGSENLLGIASMAEAVSEISKIGSAERARLQGLRDLLWKRLEASLAPVFRITPENSLVNTLLLRIPECRSDDLVVSLDLRGVSASRGSACNSGTQRPSHVLAALNFSELASKEVIRFSLDWTVDESMLSKAADEIEGAVFEIRNSLRRSAA